MEEVTESYAALQESVDVVQQRRLVQVWEAGEVAPELPALEKAHSGSVVSETRTIRVLLGVEVEEVVFELARVVVVGVVVAVVACIGPVAPLQKPHGV